MWGVFNGGNSNGVDVDYLKAGIVVVYSAYMCSAILSVLNGTSTNFNGIYSLRVHRYIS